MSLIPFGFWGGITAPPIVTTNLILHWDAGNASSYPGSGTSIQDLTASNYDGTLNGAVYSSADGGSFIHVEAESDWINSIGTASGNGVVNTSDYTVEIWTKPTNINQQAWLFGNRNGQAGPQLSIVLGTPSDGGTIASSKKIGSMYINTNTSTARVLSTVNDVIDGSWKHIVMTRVGLTLKMYVNGVEQTLNTAQSVGSSLDITNTLTWRVGDNGNGNGLFAINGATSINRLYNKALTLTEVLQNYNAQKSRYEGGLPLAGLKMYFNFEGGGFSGSVVTDFASVTNGTLTGGTYNSGSGGYMTLNGTSDFINTNRTSNVSDIGIFYGSWSIVYCVRFPNVTGIKYVFGSSNAPGVNTQSGAENNTIIYLQNGNKSVYSTILANTWYHVVATYDYNSYTPKIYINGVLQVTGFAERMTASGWTVYLGRTNSTYYPFDLGLAMIYNKVITASEITDIFNNQKTRFGLT